MHAFYRLMAVEFLKLRHSAVLRVLWLFPLLYLFIEFFIFERPVLGIQALPAEFSKTFDTGQIKMVGTLWAGFFHPLMLALLPALLFRPEHRFKLWGHLHSQPVPRRLIFFSKALMAFIISAGILILIGIGHGLERSLVSRINPLLVFPFHGAEMARVLAWLWLGSLPVLTFYLWASDRINSLAISIVFGLVGLMLTISMSGADVPQAWRRDLIPWVLPYFCAQQSIQESTARQEFHAAAAPFRLEDIHPPDEEIIQLPSGRKYRISGPPWDTVFPPPKPTPPRVLALFSLAAGALILALGLADAGRNRL